MVINMNKFIKAGVCALLSAMSIGQTAFAQFSDMPDGEIGAALQSVVDAGLIKGITDTTIEPDSYITRAQMAEIIARAFGAMETDDNAFAGVEKFIYGGGYNVNTNFNDIAGDEWYAAAVSKAVRMGVFQGDTDNNFNPSDNITFQETYTVLARVFSLIPQAVNYADGTSEILGDVSETVLDSFSDKDDISSWAVDFAGYIAGGGWKGIDGKLMPEEYITRGQFALLMDTLVGAYIDEPGEYSSLPDGIIMVRSGGVTIDGVTTDKNIIVTYGVDENGFKLTNSTVNGALVILGGADKTPVLKAASAADYTADELNISLDGSSIYQLRILAPYIGTDASSAKKLEHTYAVKGSVIKLPAIDKAE